MIHSLEAYVKVRRIYTCAVCKLQQAGDVETHTACNTEGLQTMVTVLERYPGRSHHMPAGWGYSHGGAYRCPAHLTGVQDAKPV